MTHTRDAAPAPRPSKPIVSQLSFFGGRILDAAAIPGTQTILALESTQPGSSFFVRSDLDEKSTTVSKPLEQQHDHIDLFPSSQRSITYKTWQDGNLDCSFWALDSMTCTMSDTIDGYSHPTTVKFGNAIYRIHARNPGHGEYQLACTDFSNELEPGEGTDYPLNENPNCLAAIPDTSEFLVGDSKGCAHLSITDSGNIAKIGHNFGEQKGIPATAVAVIAQIAPPAATPSAVAAPPAPNNQVVITGYQNGTLQTWQRTLTATGTPLMQALGELLPDAGVGARIDYLMPIPEYSFVMMIANRKAYWVDISIPGTPSVAHSVDLRGDYQHEKRKCSYTRDAKLVTPYGEVIDAVSYPDAFLQTAASELNRRSVAGHDVTALMLGYFGIFPPAKINTFSRATVEDIAETAAAPAAKK